MSVGAVVVAHQVGWRRGRGECLGDLPGQPLGCRMPCHFEPQQLSPAVPQNQERKQEIARSASAQRTYRWRQSPQRDFAEVFQVCDGGFEGRVIYFETVDWATSKPSIRSLAMNPGCAKVGFPSHTRWIRSTGAINPWPPCPMTRLPTPKYFEPSAMPTQDGLRLNHLHRIKKARPKPRHPYEQSAITTMQTRSR